MWSESRIMGDYDDIEKKKTSVSAEMRKPQPLPPMVDKRLERFPVTPCQSHLCDCKWGGAEMS
jgi:hypothetical protein